MNAIKKDIAYICPLVISKAFLDTSVNKREWGIFIGNLSSAKNPFFLLEACLLLQKKNIKFHINIIWEDRIWFYHQIKKYHLEDYLSILWFIPHNSIKEYLRNAEILINTSLGEWQCIAVYEWALSGCVLCVPNILSFPSVFWENALYHNSVEELSDNVILYLKDKEIFEQKIIANQNMILSEYNYTTIYWKLKQLFLWV